MNKQKHSLSLLIHDLLETDQEGVTATPPQVLLDPEYVVKHEPVVEAGGTLADEVVTQVNFLYR